MEDRKRVGKLAAAKRAAEVLKEHVAENHSDYANRPIILGIGSGSTVAEFVPIIAKDISALSTHGIRCVPTSLQSEMLIIEHGLPLSSLNVDPEIDFIIDGADELYYGEEHAVYMIKGGGGAMTSEKIVRQAAKGKIYMVDESKLSPKHFGDLKQPVPVEVLQSCYVRLLRQLRVLLPSGQVVDIKVRLCSSGKAGPVITDHGNMIIDVTPISDFDVAAWNVTLNSLEGVVGHGLFLENCDYVVIGRSSGEAEVVKHR